MPEAPTDGTVYGRQGSTGTWVGALPLSGGTVTGATTFGAAGTGLSVSYNAVITGTLQAVGGLTAGNAGATTGASITINGLAANQRHIDLLTSNSLRWRLGANPTGEGGSNAGSDFIVNAYTDAGGLLATALQITRSTQQTAMVSAALGSTFSYAGTAPSNAKVPLFVSANFTGSTDHSGWTGFNNVNINTDTLDVGASQQAIGLYWNQNFGGSGITGSRTGARFQVTQTGICPAAANYQGGLFSSTCQYSSGGTDLWANAAGVAFGGAAYVSLSSAATNYRGIAGFEIDYGIASGASAAGITGLQVVRWSTHAFSPATWEADTAIILGSGIGAVGAKIGLAVGVGTGDWPIDAANGRLLGAGFTNHYSDTKPMRAAHGIDLYNVDLTGTAFRARGFSVQGSGASVGAGTVQVGNAYLSSGALDVSGSTCTAAAVASGGANLSVGTPLIHDATGTLAVVSAVTGGVATAVVLTANTGFAITPPANPVTFRVGYNVANPIIAAPTAPTLTLTWTAANGLSLNPTGQHIGFNGTAPIAKPTVTGAKGSNAALASLMTALAAYGLVQDSTTA